MTHSKAQALCAMLGIAVAVSQFSAVAHSGVGEREYLFVQQASEAQVSGDELVMTGIGPVTVYFSDRPDRDVGHITNAEFLDAWTRGADSFAEDPPNASITFRPDGHPETAVVELMEPALEEDELRYTVRVLEGELPERFGPVSLFVDSGGLMQLVADGAQDIH